MKNEDFFLHLKELQPVKAYVIPFEISKLLQHMRLAGL